MCVSLAIQIKWLLSQGDRDAMKRIDDCGQLNEARIRHRYDGTRAPAGHNVSLCGEVALEKRSTSDILFSGNESDTSRAVIWLGPS